MGVGKTAVCQKMKRKLHNSVFLDGDWCWDSDPFQVTEETKEMVMQNICFLLNQFLHCSAYDHMSRISLILSLRGLIRRIVIEQWFL